MSTFFQTIDAAQNSNKKGPLLQTKLRVGQANDEYEREADEVADQVMKMPASQISPVQRKCHECEEEELQMKPLGTTLSPIVQKQAEEEEEEVLQMKKSSSHSPALSSGLEASLQQSKGGGQQLPPSTHSFMSNVIGTDFSKVKIHTDANAVQMNRQLNARAFTHGQDIYFNQGQYNPRVPEGKRLLAHELTHVVQQNGERGKIQRAASDFRITEIAPEDAAIPNMIFFNPGNTAIPATETHKIAPLATPPSQNLTLNGFSSEEGSDATNDAIIASRIQSVDAALTAVGHTGVKTPVNLRASGEGQIDYRHMRSVEVLPTPGGGGGALAPAPSGVSPCATAGSQVEPCGTAFTNSWPDADAAMSNAVSALTPPITAQASTLLSTLFNGVPQATVLANITSLAAQVHVLPTHHRCHNNCDGGCDRPAYNTGTGVAPPPAGSMITLCPEFLNSPNQNWQSRILIHESAHGTAGLSAEDIAYANSRQISFLTPADQERNTDSYVLLAWLLYRPGSITIGPSTADTLTGMNAAEQTSAREAIAWLESWLNYGSFDTAILYDTVNRSVPPAATWASQSGDAFSRETMHLLAPIFGLTDPGTSAPFTLPTDRDKNKIAAIHDRYEQMYSTVNWQVLSITKGAVGSDSWGSHGASLPRLDQDLTVGPGFFVMTPVDRIKHLVFLMADAMYGISSGFRQKYADALDRIRTHRTLGP